VRIEDFDDIDRAILRELMRDGRITNAELSERVHLSPSACLRRTRALEESGVIAGYVALLDAGKAMSGRRPVVKGLVEALRTLRVRSCLRPHMRAPPSIVFMPMPMPIRGELSFPQGFPCQPHIRRDHDPGHCPAFGTGELRRNGTTL
jgi:hypothetical protein